MELLHKQIPDGIISVFYDVYNTLGYGFLEKVYQNSMEIELKSRGFIIEPQKKIQVYYKGFPVGDYYADIIVNNAVILELKAAEYIIPEFESQLLNYLKASDLEVGLLLNFGKKPELKRKIYSNENKTKLP